MVACDNSLSCRTKKYIRNVKILAILTEIRRFGFGDLHIPSTSIPLGTKGTDPVAMIISLAVITLSFPYLTFCGPWTSRIKRVLWYHVWVIITKKKKKDNNITDQNRAKPCQYVNTKRLHRIGEIVPNFGSQITRMVSHTLTVITGSWNLLSTRRTYRIRLLRS